MLKQSPEYKWVFCAAPLRQNPISRVLLTDLVLNQPSFAFCLIMTLTTKTGQQHAYEMARSSLSFDKTITVVFAESKDSIMTWGVAGGSDWFTVCSNPTVWCWNNQELPPLSCMTAAGNSFKAGPSALKNCISGRSMGPSSVNRPGHSTCQTNHQRFYCSTARSIRSCRRRCLYRHWGLHRHRGLHHHHCSLGRHRCFHRHRACL